jgi:hypothetical protein
VGRHALNHLLDVGAAGQSAQVARPSETGASETVVEYGLVGAGVDPVVVSEERSMIDAAVAGFCASP